MYKLDYTLTTLSSVIIAKNSGDPNMVATEDYISGSSILGALANLYIKNQKLDENAHANETFYKWFLSGDLKFCNAYIYCEDSDEPYLPTPLSIHRHKKSDDPNACFDLMFVDKKDGTTYIGGYCNINGTSINTCDVKRSINFHHERDYTKGSTKEGIIFNYESIDEGQTFKGVIIARDKELLDLLIQTFGTPLELNIGKSRTAQYGRVRFDFDKPAILTHFKNDYDTDDEITLTFISPVILLNEYGFSSADIDSIKKALGEGVEISKAFIRTEQYEGFSSIWGLKKPSEICITAGSCLLIKANSEAIERLKALELSGIGQRTNEGFGRFVLGMQQDNEKLSISQSKKVIKEPTPPMPETVKTISKSLIQDYIIKKASIEAINDAKGFSKNPPTKSLISRLEAMMRRHGKMEIDNLRKTAKDKLEDCNNGSKTLMDFLKSDTWQMLSSVLPKNNEFLSKIGYDPSTDKDLKDILHRQYWLSFFASMRKEIKARKAKIGG